VNMEPERSPISTWRTGITIFALRSLWFLIKLSTSELPSHVTNQIIRRPTYYCPSCGTLPTKRIYILQCHVQVVRNSDVYICRDPVSDGATRPFSGISGSKIPAHRRKLVKRHW